MKVCYVCKAVDESNATVATQVRWIRALAQHPRIEQVLVLTRDAGLAILPENVTVRSFGSMGWPRTIARFFRHAARLRPSDVDCFFVAQGGPYPALLLPLKCILRRPLYQWKAHPHISPRMRFYARYCDDLVFTPTPGSFPMALGSIRVVGHGIDTELFRPLEATKVADLLALGRIAPVKRLDLAIEALAQCRERGFELGLDIVGPCAAKDEPYRRRLVALAEQRGLGDRVRFYESVHHGEVPELLSRYRATVNLSLTAFDKCAGESMAVGVPVVSTNHCTHEMLPDDLRPLLAADDDVDGVARVMHQITSWDDKTRTDVGRRLRSTIVADHSLEKLFDKIIEAIEADRGLPRPLRSPRLPDAGVSS